MLLSLLLLFAVVAVVPAVVVDVVVVVTVAIPLRPTWVARPVRHERPRDRLSPTVEQPKGGPRVEQPPLSRRRWATPGFPPEAK